MTDARDAPLEPAFELFEVTADVGVVARGPTPEAVLAEAARGMYAVMVELDGVREHESRVVDVRAADLDHLLERWLLELLFVTESEGLLFSRFDVTLGGDGTLHATVHGEPIDAERHALGPEVKAVTRHQLAFGPVPGGYEARVIFDI